MIIIISYHGDGSTVKVMKWLRKLNVPVMRLNFGDIVNRKIPVSINISNDGAKMVIDSYEINDNTFVWYRKTEGFYNIMGVNDLNKHSGAKNFINKEFDKFIDCITKIIPESRWLCHPSTLRVNKVDVLNKARICGLKIPDTLVTNNKIEVDKFLNGHKKNITKTLGDGLTVNIEGKYYFINPTLINDTNFQAIPDFFIPSILQNYIEKEVELRIFYLDKKIFATALLSQKNDHTKIDFRIVPKGKRMARVVPFNLPKHVEEKIISLMLEIGLNTGSVDMIYTKDREYVFLEVNPAGQYDWISVYANFGIDKYIAKYLKNKIQNV